MWRYAGDRFDPKTPAVLSPEHRQKLRLAHLGMKHSEQTKQRLSDVQRGKKLSLEHRKKIGSGVRKHYEVVNGS